MPDLSGTTVLFVRLRRLPILCLLLSSLVAWPDAFPLEAMGPSRPVDPSTAWARKILTDTSVSRSDALRPLQWSRGQASLNDSDGDGEDEKGDRAPQALPASGMAPLLGLFSLVPPPPAPDSTARPGPTADLGGPPLRC